MELQFCVLLSLLGFLIAEPISATSETYCESINKIETDELSDQSRLAEEFPHLVALGYQTEKGIQYSCRGVLISDSFVVTAAHCAFNRNAGSPTKVRLGELSLKDRTDESYLQERNISEMIVHPNFKAQLAYNDIALVKMEKAVKFTAYVKPICIENRKEIGENKFTALIYGTDPFGPDRLGIQQKVVAERVNFEDCNKEYAMARRRLPNGIDKETHICARGNGVPLCDLSGMPLQVNNRLVGIASFGKLCSVITSPSVYVKIAAFAPWIESVVWKQVDDSVHFE